MLASVATWTVNLCLIALCFQLWQMRMWLTYTAFTCYVFAATALALIPNPTGNIELWRTIWAWMATPVTVLLALALIEVLWFAMLELDGKERLFIFAALTALIEAAIVSGFIMRSNASSFMIFRQFSRLGLAIAGVLGGLYIWSRGIILERNTQRHLIILVAMLVTRAIISAINDRTGIWRLYPQSVLVPTAKFAHAFFLILWITMLRRPKRHWWIMLGSGTPSVSVNPGSAASRH